MKNYIEDRIAQLTKQLRNPECGNPLKIEHKLEAYREMYQEVKSCSIPHVGGSDSDKFRTITMQTKTKEELKKGKYI